MIDLYAVEMRKKLIIVSKSRQYFLCDGMIFMVHPKDKVNGIDECHMRQFTLDTPIASYNLFVMVHLYM